MLGGRRRGDSSWRSAPRWNACTATVPSSEISSWGAFLVNCKAFDSLLRVGVGDHPHFHYGGNEKKMRTSKKPGRRSSRAAPTKLPPCFWAT